MNTLEIEEREAKAAKHGAEVALREVRAALREVRREKLGACPDLHTIEEKLLTALQRTVGGFEREIVDATERFQRSPTERNLAPVRLAANTNG